MHAVNDGLCIGSRYVCAPFLVVCEHFPLEPHSFILPGLGGTLFFIIHIYSCLYWYIKISVQTEDQIEDFLSGFDLLEASSVEKWIVSGYFINTIFSTVGFGDIKAENTSEMLFIIVAEWTGALVFAFIISQVFHPFHLLPMPSMLPKTKK